MSIIKRNNKWYVQFTAPSGERIRASARTTSKQEAQEFHDRLKAQYWRTDILKDKQAYIFEEACLKMLKESEGQRSIEDKKRHIKYWLEVFAGRDISSITQDEIIANLPTKIRTCNHKERILKPATKNRYLATIKTVLSSAKKAQWIDNTPYIPTFKEPKKRIRWLTKKEAYDLIQAMTVNWMKDVSLFALLTGARANEILSLTWDKVDIARSIAWVTPDLAKSGVARAIPLNKQAVEILARRKLLGHYWCFTRDNGDHGRVTSTDRRVLVRAAKQIGIPPIKFHDFRHTWASWHVQSGTPLMVLKELGGWETIEMVQKYAHLDAGHLAEFAQASGF